jgi:hypothetical protein
LIAEPPQEPFDLRRFVDFVQVELSGRGDRNARFIGPLSHLFFDDAALREAFVRDERQTVLLRELVLVEVRRGNLLV